MFNDIVYIKTEPIVAESPTIRSHAPVYRCTIELADGSTIMRCGMTEQHAVANAIAIYKTSFQPRKRTE
jgi:hypothetical protein